MNTKKTDMFAPLPVIAYNKKRVIIISNNCLKELQVVL